MGVFANALRSPLAVGLAAVLGLAAPLAAVDEIDQKYLDMRAELLAMVESRDTEIFELDFKPLEVDRILLRGGPGGEEVYHYITFRLRNRVSDNAKFLIEHASAFNEVMDAITKEYEGLTFSTEGGPRLDLQDASAIEDKELATIVDRADLKVRSRAVNITVRVDDENTTRFRLFDEEPGEGPQEAFDFEDLGETRYGQAFRRVREAIEEKEGRRLLSVHEIRGKELKPYDPQVRDDEGVAQGEVYGVLVFDRWPVEGDRFRVRIQGLSNKLRFGDFQIREGTPEPKDQVQDYFNARIMRRTYQMTIERPGDEYFLDQAEPRIVSHGWTWAPAFERVKHRASMAYAKYYLDNIELEEERTGPDGLPQLHDPEIAVAARDYYDQSVTTLEERFQQRIDAVAAEREDVRGYYQALMEEDTVGAEDLGKRLQRRIESLDAREQELKDQLARLRDQRPDFWAELEER